MFDVNTLAGTVIVSCQAPRGSPLRRPDVMAAFAEAAVLGGASAIRANGADDVAAIKERVPVPVIGLQKRRGPDDVQWITPTLGDARALVDAGADIIALDATLRPRPGTGPATLIRSVRDEFGVPVLADVDEAAAAVRAADAGADAVATTLAGYTAATFARPTDAGTRTAQPDIGLVAQLARTVACPVIAEGRYHTPQQVADAMAAGALAVVVGTAITNPLELTRRFVAAVGRHAKEVT